MSVAGHSSSAVSPDQNLWGAQLRGWSFLSVGGYQCVEPIGLDQGSMYFEPQAVPAELAPLVRRFVSITTWKPWAGRLENFDRRVADNPLLDEYFAQRYPIELAMGRLHRRLVRGQRIDLPETYADTVLLSFVSMVARVYARLSPRGQVRLAGMLRSGLDGEAGLAPLEQEMGMAAHLMGRGFDVTFSDIETGNGFDLLAERNGATLEVECKTVSGDLGRKDSPPTTIPAGRSSVPTHERGFGAPHRRTTRMHHTAR